ncbi:MAG: alpha/beta fold hydrolase [Planctomycetota bacterium]
MNHDPHKTPELRPARTRRGRRWLIRLLIVTMAIGMLWLTGIAERLFYHPDRAELDPPAEHRAEVFHVELDGRSIEGWFLHAAGIDSRNAPTIFHVHGNAGNIDSHLGFVDHLPAYGFNVVMFDYRGYGGSDGRAWSRNGLIADTTAVLAAIRQRDDIDPDRIGMYGQSLGGAIGLNVMAEDGGLRCAVIESAFTSWREIASNAVGGDPPAWYGRGLARVLIKDHARPVDAIGWIEAPILLLHGTADRVIPMSHSVRLHNAAQNAELLTGNGGRHNTLRGSHPELDDAMIAFFREHLGEVAETE